MNCRLAAALVVIATLPLASCVHSVEAASGARPSAPAADRPATLRRAQVWSPTEVGAMDVRTGPTGDGSFAPEQTLTCDYSGRPSHGRSPKFACVIAPGDEVKVKYGRENGEVYGEVASTRLLWALGFGADHMYPVQVICRGCPSKLGGAPPRDTKGRLFDVAAVERKMPGHDLMFGGREGWSWRELDVVDESAGGASRAQRDALKLLAAFIQHTDSKAEQQRIVCLDPHRPGPEAPCGRPFLIIDDLGMTFGRANMFNRDGLSAANFERWSQTEVWKGRDGCVANIPKSATGTLDNPVIGEAGRAFLASLLVELTDAQLRDLFEVARFNLRPRAPNTDEKQPATVAEWVDAFTRKRSAIVDRHCAD
jgi:hypothetical protein